MRQRRWLELVKDYDMEIPRHPDKANVQKITQGQQRCPYFAKVVKQLETERIKYFLMTGDGCAKKMYQDLKTFFWWPGMKKDVAEYIGMHGLPLDSGRVFRKPLEENSDAQSRQKSYADVRRKDLEFEVGDHDFLKVAPVRGVLQFGKRGKLSPRFIGSFEILERIGPIAYKLALPPTLDTMHNIFHVSMLRKYVVDPMHILRYKDLELKEDLSYEERPVKILAREVRSLRSKDIPFVKVLWKNQQASEATWEREEVFKQEYPHLFVELETFEDESS
ncbi:uncharacterized protein LOC111471618 [Cucurbita maxima]|uniref:Uncharacterized protein LOC111471618 n=1 Tax=Cucurbita maxima TaxID=3661 RepID=A0A6J1I6K4_CUCMA|nr:uncharacterized protein LOC111471618 [Cucurbita maxima]